MMKKSPEKSQNHTRSFLQQILVDLTMQYINHCYIFFIFQDISLILCIQHRVRRKVKHMSINKPKKIRAEKESCATFLFLPFKFSIMLTSSFLSVYTLLPHSLCISIQRIIRLAWSMFEKDWRNTTVAMNLFDFVKTFILEGLKDKDNELTGC